MTIQGLLFDFDGLILDTETPEYDLWCKIFQEFGQSLPLELWARAVGASLDAFHPAAYLQTLTNREINVSEVEQRHRAASLEIILQSAPILGVTDFLEHARQSGIKMAVASSSDRAWVGGHLSRLGLTAYFETICTREDVAQVKPNPALYLTACQRLGLQPAETVVFEDSPNGITAGVAAGCHVVAVPNALTRHLDTSHAHWVVPSLKEVTLEKLNQRFNGHSR